MTEIVTALIVGAWGAAAGWYTPELIARVPEPLEPDDATLSYGEVSRLPGLNVRLAVIGALLSAATGWLLGPQWELAFYVVGIPLALALAAIDWHTHLLPKVLVLPLYPAFLVLAAVGMAVEHDLGVGIRALAGLAIGFGGYFLLHIINSRGMGYGDVRLAGPLGLMLGAMGWGELLVGLYAGFVVGGVVGLGLVIFRVVDRKGYPFGPFMLGGAILGIWSGALFGAA